MVDVSILIPVYFNESSIEKTISTIKKEVIQVNKDLKFEIICVDDGSKDSSFKVLEKLYLSNRSLIKVIKLTRNFGQIYAWLAGYEMSTGKCVINISADLQDPPELMNEMINEFFNKNIEIVIGTRKDRDESYFRKKTSALFYKLIRKLSFQEMPYGGFDYALLSNRVVKIMLNNQEPDYFWQGQILWTGLPVKFIPYSRQARELGKSKWTFAKKIKYLVDGVISYSIYPIRFMSILGLIVFIGGLVYAGIISVLYFTGDIPYKGWAPIMILILLLFGLVFLMLGIIGEYLWRVLEQSRNRQLFIVEKELV